MKLIDILNKAVKENMECIYEDGVDMYAPGGTPAVLDIKITDTAWVTLEARTVKDHTVAIYEVRTDKSVIYFTPDSPNSIVYYEHNNEERFNHSFNKGIRYALEDYVLLQSFIDKGHMFLIKALYNIATEIDKGDIPKTMSPVENFVHEKRR